MRAHARRIAAVLFVVFAALAAGWGFWSWKSAPYLKARMVANILAGRDPCDVNARGTPTLIRRYPEAYVLLSRCDVADDAEWASRELQRLAKERPTALVRAAIEEPAPDVRWAFLDLVENHPAYDRRVPLPLRIEHIAVHAVRRMDRPDGRTLTPGQESALREGRMEALTPLRNVLRNGHCGALPALDLIGEQPTPEDLREAGSTLSRAASDPLTDLPRTVQEHCLAQVAERSAPKTDGSFGMARP